MNLQSISNPTISEIIITPATWRDTMPFYRLERLCFPIDAWPLLDVFFSLVFSDVVSIKAAKGEQLVGIIIGDMRRSKGFAWIATIAVHPDFRGRGIGSALIQACERQITTPRMRLSVRSTNEQAIRLYRRLGYQQTAKWPKYFKGGGDALVMEKTIKR